jgi:hypothetical protein
MKRLALATLLLLGGALSAHADNDIYDNTMKQARNDDALHADTARFAIRSSARRRTALRPRGPTNAACSPAAGASITRCASAPAASTCIPIPIIPA